jgi:hypothetical protein
LFFGDEHRGFLNEGVKTYHMKPMSPLNLPIFFRLRIYSLLRWEPQHWRPATGDCFLSCSRSMPRSIDLHCVEVMLDICSILEGLWEGSLSKVGIGHEQCCQLGTPSTGRQSYHRPFLKIRFSDDHEGIRCNFGRISQNILWSIDGN